jgi:hypothetical protein
MPLLFESAVQDWTFQSKQRPSPVYVSVNDTIRIPYTSSIMFSNYLILVSFAQTMCGHKRWCIYKLYTDVHKCYNHALNGICIHVQVKRYWHKSMIVTQKHRQENANNVLCKY